MARNIPQSQLNGFPHLKSPRALVGTLVICSIIALLWMSPPRFETEAQLISPGAGEELPSEHTTNSVPASSESSRQSVKKETIQFRVLPPDTKTALSGNGTLFAGASGSAPQVGARGIDVRDWSGVIHVESWENVAVVAVAIDGVPLRVVDAARPSGIQVRVAHDQLIEVVDLAGQPVSQAYLVEDRRENFEQAADYVHPGIVHPGQRVIDEVGSPIWFNPPESHGTLHWVGAPDRGFKAVTFGKGRPRFQKVQLGPGGSLEITVSPPLNLHLLAARVLCSDGLRIMTDALRVNPTRLDGLSPGLTSVELVASSDGEGPALQRDVVTVSIGGTAQIQLSNDGIRAADRGHLSGTIRLPSVAPPLLNEIDLVLAVTRVSRHDGSHITRPTARRLPISAMAATESVDTRVWEFGEVDPGGYILEIQPLGFTLETWVELSQRRTIEIELPELSEYRVQFVDEASLTPIRISIPEVIRQTESLGRSMRLSTTCRVHAESGSVTFLGIAGPVLFQVVSPTHGTFWHPVDVEGTSQAEIVRVPRGTWIDLTFVADLDDPSRGSVWHGKVAAWRGSLELDLRWYESWIVQESTSKVSLCVPGVGAVELRFAPDEGSSALPPLEVPAAEPDPASTQSSKRRPVYVLAQPTNEQVIQVR
jgi:hypothetical protein